ncbi:MAG TPA: homoserine dehydrogenase [Gemmatimonadaceae bacterium]|nr:homoserine dehydrogenase [Gemmatimonadaceae bacterium]
MAREVESARVRVGLAGCGVVGGALVRLLDESAESIESRYGVKFELSRVLVRDAERDRGLPVPNSLFTSDRQEFLSHETDIVVEAIGGCDPASEIARSSLSRGRRFVTANKELIASEGAELASLAREKSAALDFGASVGGSAPVISLLRDLLGTSTPRSVRGILNGTSNYVLTLIERGASLEHAIEEARSRGLAEANCTRDLDGSDVSAKLAIVVWMSFGIAPSAVRITRTGIMSQTPHLIEAARVLGGKVRLVGECEAVGKSGVAAWVEPVVFDENHAFARTELEDNRIEVDLGWTSPLTVSGPGAGGVPTATALLGDLLNFAPRANDKSRFPATFECVEDLKVHRWLVANAGGWTVFTATRREVREKFSTTEGGSIAIARLELPVISSEAS